MDTQYFGTAHQKVVVSPLVVAAVLDCHKRVGKKLQACLCTIFGTIRDDGSVLVRDALACHPIEHKVGADGDTSERGDRDDGDEADGDREGRGRGDGESRLIFPEKVHLELCVQAHARVAPKDILLGWASTELDGVQFQALSDWARQDMRNSRFIPHKKLLSPLLLKVTINTNTNTHTHTETNTKTKPTQSESADPLSVACYVKGSVTDCLLKPLPTVVAQPSFDVNAILSHSELVPSLDALTATPPPPTAAHQLRDRLAALLEAITSLENAARENPSALSSPETQQELRRLYTATSTHIPLSKQALIDHSLDQRTVTSFLQSLTNFQTTAARQLAQSN